MEINPSQYASQRAKFFGSDARITVIFLVAWLLYKAWITFILFIAIFIFSVILEYNNIEFLSFLKKMKLMFTGISKKRIRKTY